MPRIIKELPAFQAIAAGQEATLNAPVGLTYHQILLRYIADVTATPTDATPAVFAADIDEIRWVIDAETKWQLSGAELNALNNYYQVPAIDGAFPLLFSRPWQRTMGGEDEIAYGTAGGSVQTATLEIDINPAAANPKLSAFAVLGPPSALGRHVAMRRFGQTYAGGVGEFEISDLPRGPYATSAIHFDTANIGDVEVEVDQRKVYEADQAIADAYTVQTDRTPQAGFTHVDFAPTNRLGDVLPLQVQDFRIKLGMTAATPTFRAIMERVEGRAANQNGNGAAVAA